MVTRMGMGSTAITHKSRASVILEVGSTGEFIMGADVRGRGYGRSILVTVDEEEAIRKSPLNSK